MSRGPWNPFEEAGADPDPGRSLAVYVAGFYRGLLDNGVGAEMARDLARDLALALVGAILRIPPARDA